MDATDRNDDGTAERRGRTLVTLLLDRSGSMQSLKSDTIGAINAYREELRRSAEDIRYSQVHFDTPASGRMGLERVCVAEPIASVPDMTEADYHPRGSTPLIDAACATIRAVADSLSDPDRAARTKVVIAIQTDGMENASVENSWTDLKALIAEKEKAGWQFVFMGAGIDAYAQGERMGIARDNTLSYGTDRRATKAAFAATARNTASFAAGSRASMHYSDEQKQAAGDPG
jgi:uncharacterized protein YegL